jgi:hypothetical protein
MSRLLLLCLLAACAGTRENNAPSDAGVDAVDAGASTPQYLTFQVFIYGPPPDGKVPSPALNKAAAGKTIDDIVAAVNGEKGDGKKRQLGFALGPLALDHTDDQLREIIAGGFALAEEKSVAVAFHMDNSMFWMRRSDLWGVHENIEWTDWGGTAAAGQEIGWLSGAKLAPQMCWNSPGLKKEISRVTRDVVGAEIKRGVEHLRAIGKEHLYAGFIAGWETFIQPNTGYCALTNLGYSASKPPANMDEARATLTHDWAEFFTGELGVGGVPSDKLYTHMPLPTNNELAIKIGAPPSTAFNKNSHAGFSTYTLDKYGAELFADLEKRGNPRWASAEGLNYNLEGPPSTLTWDRYLGDMLNHNAALVVVFAWNDPSPLGMVTGSSEAKASYLKFVRGEPLP